MLTYNKRVISENANDTMCEWWNGIHLGRSEPGFESLANISVFVMYGTGAGSNPASHTSFYKESVMTIEEYWAWIRENAQ